MNKNAKVVPVCIMYLNGVRLNVTCEGAFRGITVINVLDKTGKSYIHFDFAELGRENRKEFDDSLDSEVSMHLGFKDNTREVFFGRITATEIDHSQYGSKYIVTVSSFLSLLEHGRKVRTFERMTPSQAIKTTLDRYNLQADCEPFGPEIPFWQSHERTDLQMIRDMAKQYGRDICCIGKKVYVKRLKTMLKDEHIYERGKNLISFEVKESFNEQVWGVRTRV